MQALRIEPADLNDPRHADAALAMIDMYARDPMGGGRGLDPAVRARLIEGLRSHPTTLVLLAWRDDQPVGVAVCFIGYSTFRAAPLLNIHDLAVIPAARGRGVGRALLDSAARHARARGCCRVTLEVLDRNHPARRAYAAAGFAGAMEHDPARQTLFCTLELDGH